MKKISIVFDDTLAVIINNKKLNSIVTALFIRGRNIPIAFIIHSYFEVPKDIRQHTMYCFSMKIPSKSDMQQIAINH